jgi:serine/threonine protein phosphatase 1
MRRYVIGDIHGCSKALQALTDELKPGRDDTLIFLGDFIDRGPDSRGVIDLVVQLSRQTRVVSLRGNHEVMLMGVLFGGLDPGWWKKSGGHSTLASYGGSLERIPQSHLDFYRSLRCHHETERELFIHASYSPDCPIEQTDEANRYWNHPTQWPGPHISGKRVYVGHTPQASGEVLNLGHLVCVDTYCFGGGWLTAMDLDSHQILQASRHGHLRRAPIMAMLNWCKQLLRKSTSPHRAQQLAESSSVDSIRLAPAAHRSGTISEPGQRP